MVFLSLHLVCQIYVLLTSLTHELCEAVEGEGTATACNRDEGGLLDRQLRHRHHEPWLGGGALLWCIVLGIRINEYLRVDVQEFEDLLVQELFTFVFHRLSI